MTRSKIAPSGLRYADVCEIIEQIAKEKAHQYRRIAFYDEDDIKQEVRIKCLRTLNTFDPTRSGANLKIYLAVCADNRLKDIKRSVVYKHTSPCLRCPFLNDNVESGSDMCLIHADRNNCEKFSKHDKYVMSKLSINSPGNIEEQKIVDGTAEHERDRTDFTDYIFERIPSGLFDVFNRFKDFNFNLTSMKPKERMVIVDIIKGIVDIGDFDGNRI